jgi:hypothetical protein
MQKGLYITIFLLFTLGKIAAAPATHHLYAVPVEKNGSYIDYKKENYTKKSLKQRVNNFITRTIAKLSRKRTLAEPGAEEKIEKKALWAKWLGIGSLIGLLIPGVNLLSLPAAVLAVILGTETIKKTKHPGYARQGIIFGCITAGLLLIVGLIVALVTLLPVQ